MRFLLLILCLSWAGTAHASSPPDYLAEFHLSYFKGDLKTDSPTGFFGTRDNAGGNQELGVLFPDTEGQYRKTEFSLRIPLKSNAEKTSKWDICLKGGYGNADIDGITQNFDAGAQAILIPGADRAGFTILGPNGVADTLRYSHDYSWAQGSLALGRTYRYQDKVSIRPFGGIQYGHLNTNETFSGNLPVVIREFRYYTNINNNILSPFIGFEGQIRPDKLLNIPKLPFALFGSVQYALDFNDARGTDSLAFTGFTTDEVAISDNDKSHNIKAGLGLTLNPDGPLSLSIGGNFERVGNIPQIQRTGSSNANLSFGTANIWTGSVRATLRF